MEIDDINVLAISPPGQWKRTRTPQYPLNMGLGPSASLDKLAPAGHRTMVPQLSRRGSEGRVCTAQLFRLEPRIRKMTSYVYKSVVNCSEKTLNKGTEYFPRK